MAVRSTESGTVIVRLSDVPEPKRVTAADRLIEDEDLERVHPELAILIRMAALFPRQNPGLEVSLYKARRVCGKDFAC